MDLGLERAGMQCAWQVEIDEFCRKVLTKHWPDIPKFQDIKNLSVDTSANVLYDKSHGWTQEELSRCGESLRARDVNSGSGSVLRGESSSDVGLAETPGCKVPIQSPLWGEQSFSSRNEGERLRSERPRESDPEGDRNSQDALRKVRVNTSIQERTDGNSSASSRLQQAFRSNVVMPAVPSSMAQGQQGNSEKGINGKPFADSRIDLLCGGFP